MNGNVFDALKLDRVFALCYSGYPERLGPLFSELDRVGLTGIYDKVYTHKSVFDRVILNSIPHKGKLDKQPGHFNAALGHYGILKTALALGFRRIMVVEDDCRFLLDKSAIVSTVSKAPDKWDALAMDAFEWRGENSGVWSPCGFWRSAACVCFGKRMMERLVACIESCVAPGERKGLMRNFDAYFDSGLVGNDMEMYRASPNVAIQCDPPGEAMTTDVSQKYLALGINVSDYAKFEGVRP